MNQFTFEGGQKRVLIGFILLGIVCLGISFVSDGTPHHTRFWSNLLQNTVFFTGIAFISTFVLAAFSTAYAGWYTVMKRIWEAYSMFLIVGIGLFAIIIAGIWGHFHHLYHWAMDGVATVGHENYDKIIAGKSGFLNKGVYTFGTLVVVGVWYFIARKMRSLSIAEDTEGGDAAFSHHQKYRVWAAIFLPIGAFTSAALIWQWVMSIDAHWYSTMFAWYSTASWFVACMGLTILTLIYLKSKGYYQNVTPEHLHDLGKYLFGFSVFWTYLWFSQYMLIWYANVGEETVYFQLRRDEYPVLFYGNLIINFVLPFLVLMRNDTKRKLGSLGFIAALTFVGHWWDFFYMVKPGALINAQHSLGHGHGEEHAAEFLMGFHIPGLPEIGIFLGFTALFIYFTFNQLSKAALEPVNDPYIGESLHHHV